MVTKLTMNKKIIFSTLVIAFGVIMMLSCRRKVEERPFFPAAEYFTPTVVAPGTQLKIHGAVLDNATVKIDGSSVAIDSVSKSGAIIYVTVPNNLTIGSAYTIEVQYDDKNSFTFTPKLKVAAASSAIKELLIGDFDGGGIRAAISTSDFSNGQWSGNAGANSVIGIGTGLNSVPSSPAGGNYAYGTVYGGGILPSTYGFVATISSRSGLQNNLISEWPENFFSYPGSVLDESEVDMSKYYINFLVNFNNTSKSQLRIFIGNAKLPKDKRFAFTIKPSSKYPVEGWQKVSLAVNVFRTGFGFDNKAMTFDQFKTMNQFDFDIADSYNNVYNSCCEQRGELFINECCETAIKEPVQIYIDQVVLSYGGIAPSIQ